MSRASDGWEYVQGRPRWAPTVEVCLGNILVGKYGEEYDEARRELNGLVRAAQRDAAEKIAETVKALPQGSENVFWIAGMFSARDLITPNYPEEDDGE